jgi:hypothetical protein
VIENGAVTYQKVDGKTKNEFIASLTTADVEEFLCSNIEVSFSYRDT